MVIPVLTALKMITKFRLIWIMEPKWVIFGMKVFFLELTLDEKKPGIFFGRSVRESNAGRFASAVN